MRMPYRNWQIQLQPMACFLPIIVRSDGEQYVIVAGERRYRALLRNKARYAHVIIRDNVDYREVS